MRSSASASTSPRWSQAASKATASPTRTSPSISRSRKKRRRWRDRPTSPRSCSTSSSRTRWTSPARGTPCASRSPSKTAWPSSAWRTRDRRCPKRCAENCSNRWCRCAASARAKDRAASRTWDSGSTSRVLSPNSTEARSPRGTSPRAAESRWAQRSGRVEPADRRLFSPAVPRHFRARPGRQSGVEEERRRGNERHRGEGRREIGADDLAVPLREAGNLQRVGAERHAEALREALRHAGDAGCLAHGLARHLGERDRLQGGELQRAQAAGGEQHHEDHEVRRRGGKEAEYADGGGCDQGVDRKHLAESESPED